LFKLTDISGFLLGFVLQL